MSDRPLRVDPAERLGAARLLKTDDQNIYVWLLNGALRQALLRRGVRLDRAHNRYYFLPDHETITRRVEARTKTGRAQSAKKVVRQDGERTAFRQALSPCRLRPHAAGADRGVGHARIAQARGARSHVGDARQQRGSRVADGPRRQSRRGGDRVGYRGQHGGVIRRKEFDALAELPSDSVLDRFRLQDGPDLGHGVCMIFERPFSSCRILVLMSASGRCCPSPTSRKPSSTPSGAACR